MAHAFRLALLAAGHDIATIESVGRLGLPDEDQLAFAALERWTIVTFDTGDFSRLHWEWLAADRTHGGIILGTNSLLSVGELARQVVRRCAIVGGGSFANRLEYLGDYR